MKSLLTAWTNPHWKGTRKQVASAQKMRQAVLTHILTYILLPRLVGWLVLPATGLGQQGPLSELRAKKEMKKSEKKRGLYSWFMQWAF